ncbi:cell division protein CrgA [Blastococcus sp. Marseille-P5729]|uniref:cell division protein CrgA n=1 Tax=Blastococcus sp. Marseille-P5729 TaxID=2086582 RepID=UPI000D0F1673|nr:cell division protein CrgA [Blastococcus sp. Marseille-P5729]
MPKSKVRKKSVYTPPADSPLSSSRATLREPSPSWWAPVMLLFMLAGLVYIIVFYVRGDVIPFMVSLGAWNYAVGFAAIIVGLLMAMRWN